MGNAVARAHQRLNLSLLAAALALTGCVQLDWSRSHVDFAVPHERLHALVVDTATLEEVLAALGAPLYVWELPDDGLAIAYGAWSEEQVGIQVSVPLAERASADFDYSEAAAKVEGHVLFFDRQGVLTVTAEGLLRDLRSETERRPAAVE